MENSPLTALSIHPEAARIPFGTEREFAELKADISARGIEVPLEINAAGVVLDGRRRFRAATELALESVPVQIVQVDDEIDFLYRRALLRRNLTDFARLEMAEGFRAHLAAKAKANQEAAGGALLMNSSKAKKQKPEKPVHVRKEIAALVGVGEQLVHHYSVIAKHATDEEKAALRENTRTIFNVWQEVKERVGQSERKERADRAIAARPPFQQGEGEAYENRIIQGDSRKVLKTTVPDAVATLYLFSPPYPTKLVNYEGGYQYDKYWKLLRLIHRVLKEAYRTLRHGGRVAINLDQTSANEGSADTALAGKRDYMNDVKNIAYRIGFGYLDDFAWFKQKTVGSKKRRAVGSPFSPRCPSVRRNHEHVLMLYKGTRVLEGDPALIDTDDGNFEHATVSALNYDAKNKDDASINPLSFWYINPAQRKPGGHSCPFPERLVELLLKTYTYRGDLIVDPFNGSGTTTAVSQRLGRRFLGIDLSEAYCAEAQERLKANEKDDEPLEGEAA